MYYDHKRRNGMNSRFFYMLPGLWRFCVPAPRLRRELGAELAALSERSDRDYILGRVEYYNKLKGGAALGPNAPQIGELRLRGHRSAYVLDAHEYIRWFSPKLRWNYLFFDLTFVPEYPSVVKSRPIVGDNANSVLLNLDKARHFTFVKDRLQFCEKQDRFIFRGHITQKPKRIRFMEMFWDDPMCDAGIINPDPSFPPEWSAKPKATLWEHLRYKFVMAIEGNDVASNLKWIMSSNSVAVMPRPEYETWFMEGRLIPDHHYIEIKPDYSDLKEKLQYYIAHPEEAEAIVRNAHEYVAQFLDPERERLISLLVLDKYFRCTGQDKTTVGTPESVK